ncbi:MAG TPA: tetratricopeptide repeat protein [Cyclobacteriaceae bacterium]|jgi:tetratricopeptide (TPR) repeat protein|nr:tetratricopeptide repeat protein [Cyclobacteriaceae bacterium]
MKRFFSLVLLLFSLSVCGQDKLIDSLQLELQKEPSAELEIDLLNKISQAYTRLSLPMAQQFADDALEKAISINYQKGIASAYNCLGICNSIQGNYAAGLDYFIKALRIRESQKDLPATARTMNNMTRIFLYQKDYDKAIEYSNKARAILEKSEDRMAIGNTYTILGSIYMEKNDTTHALKSYRSAFESFKKGGYRNQQGGVLLKIADVFEGSKKYNEALDVCYQAMNLIDLKSDKFTQIELYQTMGEIFSGMNDRKKAIRYLHMSMKLADNNNDSNGKISSRLKLSETFKMFKQYDSSLYYHEVYSRLNTEIFNAEKAQQLATLEQVYQTDKKDQMIKLGEQKIKAQNAIIIIVSMLLIVIAASGVFLYRYSREKRRINKSLTQLYKDISEKNEEILAQSEELIEANNAISKINENLEKEVDLRTEKIKIQNQKLIEYAYFNAHNVRGPLARILGLAMLMEMESSAEALRDYNERIHFCAIELDNVIREISVKLEKEL